MAREWYAVYTKPQKEPLVRLQLEQAQLRTFYPRLRTYRFVNSHREQVIKSLFPCYIFAEFSYPEEFDKVRWAWGVKKVVGTSHQPLPVPMEVIELIRQNSQEGVVEIRPRPFLKGDLVRVIHGPFKGLLAVFERELPDKERAFILLDVLYNARVEIKSYYLAHATI